MVTYNPKDWFTLIFQFHKSDTFRILFPTMLVLGIITGGVTFLEIKYIHTSIPSLTIFHQISGFIISLVLVFRINTAYDRWWEGRKLWGSLLNNSRNIAIKLSGMIPPSEKEVRNELSILLTNYAFVLKDHLRNAENSKEIQFSNSFNENDFNDSGHMPNYSAQKLTSFVLNICKKNEHTQNDFLIVNSNLNELVEICGACERIKNTPIPYSYSIFIKKMIFLYIMTMPFVFGIIIGYWSIPLVMILFYAFASLELISEEIEDPFGTDSNDLPLDEISSKVKSNIHEILILNANN